MKRKRDIEDGNLQTTQIMQPDNLDIKLIQEFNACVKTAKETTTQLHTYLCKINNQRSISEEDLYLRLFTPEPTPSNFTKMRLQARHRFLENYKKEIGEANQFLTCLQNAIDINIDYSSFPDWHLIINSVKRFKEPHKRLLKTLLDHIHLPNLIRFFTQKETAWLVINPKKTDIIKFANYSSKYYPVNILELIMSSTDDKYKNRVLKAVQDNIPVKFLKEWCLKYGDPYLAGCCNLKLIKIITNKLDTKDIEEIKQKYINNPHFFFFELFLDLFQKSTKPFANMAQLLTEAETKCKDKTTQISGIYGMMSSFKPSEKVTLETQIEACKNKIALYRKKLAIPTPNSIVETSNPTYPNLSTSIDDAIDLNLSVDNVGITIPQLTPIDHGIDKGIDQDCMQTNDYLPNQSPLFDDFLKKQSNDQYRNVDPEIQKIVDELFNSQPDTSHNNSNSDRPTF